MSKRIFNVDAIKFIFALSIVHYHLYCNAFISGPCFGYLAVDFFFIISGYMLLQSMNNKDSTLIDFVKHKLLIFLPYLVVAELFTMVWFFCVDLFINNQSIYLALTNACNSLLCIFMLQSEIQFVHSTAWYLSVMMASIIILYPLIKKYKTNFTTVYAPLIAFLIIGFLYAYSSTINGPHDWMLICKKTLLRGLAMMCLGLFSYQCTCYLKDINLTKIGKVIISLFEIIFIITAVSSLFLPKYIDSSQIHVQTYELISLLSFFLGYVIICSQKSYLSINSNISPHLVRLACVFGTGSLIIYLNHTTYMETARLIFPSADNTFLLTFIIIMICIASIICYIAGRYLPNIIMTMFVIHNNTNNQE